MRENGNGFEMITIAESGSVGSYIDMLLDSNDEEIFAFQGPILVLSW